MILYHASLDLNIVEEFVPRVPSQAIRYIHEDGTIERICVTSSISGALTAAPWGGSDFTENIDLFPTNRLIRIYEFDTEKIAEESIIKPEYLYENDLVRDAEITGEHWITEPVKPTRTYLIKPTKYCDNYIVDDISFVNQQRIANENLTIYEEELLLEGCFTVVELYDYEVVEEDHRSSLMKVDLPITLSGIRAELLPMDVTNLFPYSPMTYLDVETREDKTYLVGIVDTRTREVDSRDIQALVDSCIESYNPF